MSKEHNYLIKFFYDYEESIFFKESLEKLTQNLKQKEFKIDEFFKEILKKTVNEYYKRVKFLIGNDSNIQEIDNFIEKIGNDKCFEKELNFALESTVNAKQFKGNPTHFTIQKIKNYHSYKKVYKKALKLLKLKENRGLKGNFEIFERFSKEVNFSNFSLPKIHHVFLFLK